MSKSNRKPVRLSPNETAIMEALWTLKSAGSKELLEHLPTKPALTTLLTYLTRLEAKGYVRREPAVRGYIYRAAVNRSYVAGRLLDQLLTQFEGRLSSLVSHFVNTRKLSAEERDRLRQLLDEAEEDGK